MSDSLSVANQKNDANLSHFGVLEENSAAKAIF